MERIKRLYNKTPPFVSDGVVFSALSCDKNCMF